MVIETSLDKLMARLFVIIVALAICALLVFLIVYRFTIGALADSRIPVTREMLINPVKWFPNSARLNARLADAELVESNLDLVGAGLHARRAVALSPYDFRFRVIQARVDVARGDLQAAEDALKAALQLAPAKRDVRYKLANLLIREGKLSESLEHFRVTVDGYSELLPATLDLVWRVSRGSFDAVDRVTGNDPKSRLTLASFLLKQSLASEAVQALSGLDRKSLLDLPESAIILNSLIAGDHFDIARELWRGITGEADVQSTLISNGGFESDIFKDFAQFNWQLSSNDHARVNIEAGAARTGARCLRIDFANRDTTALDGEIRQLVLVRPGARYKVECYAKSDDLITPTGPRLVITAASSPEWIAASDALASDSKDWQRLTVEFVAPQSNSSVTAVYVSIKMKPKNNIYEEPTRGIIRFDDFGLFAQ